jgi:hypothetical protein
MPELEHASTVNLNDAIMTCEAVDNRVREALDDEVAALKKTIGMKIFLIIFVVGYMSYAINSISRIDADFVVTSLRDRIHGDSDQMVKEASDELKRSAPTMVASLRHDLVAEVPGLRTETEHALLASVDPVAKEIEEALSSDVGKMIEDYKAQVEKTNPKLSDAEKLQRVVFALRQDFRKEVGKVATERAAEFSADLSKLNKHLKKLRESKGLSKQEQLEKDILVTWNKLAKLKIQQGDIVTSPESGSQKSDESK